MAGFEDEMRADIQVGTRNIIKIRKSMEPVRKEIIERSNMWIARNAGNGSIGDRTILLIPGEGSRRGRADAIGGNPRRAPEGLCIFT